MVGTYASIGVVLTFGDSLRGLRRPQTQTQTSWLSSASQRRRDIELTACFCLSQPFFFQDQLLMDKEQMRWDSKNLYS